MSLAASRHIKLLTEVALRHIARLLQTSTPSGVPRRRKSKFPNSNLCNVNSSGEHEPKSVPLHLHFFGFGDSLSTSGDYSISASYQ
jgi:hypothetical protein